MSESTQNKNEAQAPKCPPQEHLPTPRCIWTGHYFLGTSTRPCRLVLYYLWELKSKAADWIATPKIAFEQGGADDCMGNPRWISAPFTEIPMLFFEECIQAFDKTKN